MFQNLSRFVLPKNFRGRSALYVQLWWLVHSLFFKSSPQFAYSWRLFLLRLFGAKIGKNVLVRSSVNITYPWKVTVGDFSWIGDDVTLYSLGDIEIGANVVVSQRSYLCSADHDYTKHDFPIRAEKITIGDEAWLATDVFVAPGVQIGKGAVIGARSSVYKDMPSGVVCMGNPCVPIKNRVMFSQ